MRALLSVLSMVSILMIGSIFSCVGISAIPEEGWGIPRLIEADDRGIAMDIEMATDGNGHAIAVWQQYDGSIEHILYNIYSTVTGWGESGFVETYTMRSANNPHIAMNKEGVAISAWEQSDGTRDNIWANIYTPGIGWGDAQLIETDNSGFAFGPKVGIDDAGNAMVVWQQNDGTLNHIVSNKYVKDFGWGIPEPVEVDTIVNSYAPEFVMAGNGDAIVIWKHFGGSHYNLYSRSFSFTSGWGAIMRIDREPNGSVDDLNLISDPLGNVLAAWQQRNGSLYEIWFDRCEKGGSWGEAELLAWPSDDYAHSPKLAADGAGKVIVVWWQREDSIYRIFSKIYYPGFGWEVSEMIDDPDTMMSRDPRIAIGMDGKAVVLMMQQEGSRFDMWANTYDGLGMWGNPVRVETDNSDSVDPARVVMVGDGKYLAVWPQRDPNVMSIWSNLYVEPDSTPPILTIDGPYNGYISDIPMVSILGSTEPGVMLVIEGISVAVGDDGSFQCPIPLATGTNTITVTATDPSGNHASASRTVTYRDPIPGLLDDILSIGGSISELETEIGELEGGLDALEDLIEEQSANITDILDVMENLSSQLVSAEDNLSAMMDELDAIGEQVEGLDADSSTLQGAIADLEDRINDTGKDIEGIQNELDEARSELEGISASTGSNEDDIEDLKDGLITTQVGSLLLAFLLMILVLVILGLLIMHVRLRNRLSSMDRDNEE